MLRSPTQRRRHLYPILAWVLVAALVACAVGFGLLLFAVKAPYKGYSAPSVLVRIPPRTATVAILTSLEEGGVLRDWRLGLFALKVFYRGRTLKAGEYRFAGERSPEQVVLALVAGDVVTYRITVPEGFTASEVFALFASQGFATTVDYDRLFLLPREFDGVPAGASTLEGFLFPDTYTVTRSMTAREILAMMTRQFGHRLPPDYEAKARAEGLTLLQAATLASLIEKETAIPAERPLVAAVYRNRIARGMLLQADPTTIYALKRMGTWRGALARSELLVNEPYNTYVHLGLPPGPICNPSLASLRAAVEPAPVNYLFFVAAGDGSHLFAARFDEHDRNVARYREMRRAERDPR